MNAPHSLSPAHAAFSVPRVPPSARHAFGGIWRLTVCRFFTRGHWLALGGMLLALALFASGATGIPRYVGWVATFYVCFLVPVLAFISAGGAMRNDLRSDSIDYVFTRPIRRPAFVVFRYLAHVACAQIDFLLALGVLIGVGLFRGVPGLWTAVPLLLLAQIAVIMAFSAFGFLCGMLTSRYVIVGLAYGGIVEAGIGNVPTQLNRISMLRQVTGMLRSIANTDPAVAAGSLGTPGTLALLLTFSAVMLALTAMVFAVKEPAAGASSRET